MCGKILCRRKGVTLGSKSVCVCVCVCVLRVFEGNVGGRITVAVAWIIEKLSVLRGNACLKLEIIVCGRMALTRLMEDFARMCDCVWA